MGSLATQVKETRARRNAARATFDARLAQVKQDLNARSLGSRITERIEQDARDALEEALEIANESKGVAAGTVAALALWYLRNPIIGWLQGLFADGDEEEVQADGDVDLTSPDGNVDQAEAEDDELQDVTNY